MSTYVPFAWTEAGTTVRITRGGTLVTVVGGADARRLLARLGDSDENDQALLQRATGNYRRGNER
ncbi:MULTISPECIES: hypothetical protein [Microbacterium]|uniref:hypothetical protein n=1 Tax=Microbacterium TaxID=33882 RepID=UPI001E3F1386|nr:hypothetical protein [Microbacterium nymphoidis]MCD2500051.1 hypothetical protein [Microbacterium nymphoidis]